MIKIFLTLNKFKQYCLDKYDISNIDELETCLSKQFRFIKFKNYVRINNDLKFPEIYITTWNNSILTGVMKVVVLNSYNLTSIEPQRTFMYISVNSSFRNAGIGKKLINTYFKFCSKNKLTDSLYLSPYTKDGFFYIKPVIYKYSQLYNINIIDTGIIYSDET